VKRREHREGKMMDGRHSKQVSAQLDDTLGVVTRVRSFDKVNKKALKKRKSGEEEDFYTIPVRLQFKDKETREAAET